MEDAVDSSVVGQPCFGHANNERIKLKVLQEFEKRDNQEFQEGIDRL